MLEVWQADNTGIYDDIQTPSTYNCRARMKVGSDGKYSYTTIKPGQYGSGTTCLRPAHIHLKVTASLKDSFRELVTQMYFKNSPNLGLEDCACSGCNSANPLLQVALSSGNSGVFNITLEPAGLPSILPGPVQPLFPLPPSPSGGA
jgi:protocatechuate 3,4-dioxygenase beta subunit